MTAAAETHANIRNTETSAMPISPSITATNNRPRYPKEEIKSLSALDRKPDRPVNGAFSRLADIKSSWSPGKKFRPHSQRSGREV